VRDLSASFDLFWNSKSAVPIGALVAERAIERDYRALRKQMTEILSTACYPDPVEERIDDLRARIVEIRDAFIWAPGRVLSDDPARVGTDGDSDDITEAILHRIGQTEAEALVCEA